MGNEQGVKRETITTTTTTAAATNADMVTAMNNLTTALARNTATTQSNTSTLAGTPISTITVPKSPATINLTTNEVL